MCTALGGGGVRMQTERLQESLGKQQPKIYRELVSFRPLSSGMIGAQSACHRLSALMATKLPSMQVVIENTSTSQSGPH